MQFMLALIAEERSWEDVTPDEVKKNLAEMGQFNAELTEAGAMVFGAGLQERATGTTVHYGDGEQGTDREGGSLVAAERESVVDRTFRHESGRAVATLIRVTGDFDLAEEAVQEAFVVAVERWPDEGVPSNP